MRDTMGHMRKSAGQAEHGSAASVDCVTREVRGASRPGTYCGLRMGTSTLIKSYLIPGLTLQSVEKQT